MNGRTSGWPCVGAVQAVEADQLLLRDAPGIQNVLAVDAWLEGRRDIVDDVVRILAGPESSGILERLERAVFGLVGAEGRLAKAKELASWLGQHPLVLATGLAATAARQVSTGLDNGAERLRAVGDRLGRAGRSAQMIQF